MYNVFVFVFEEAYYCFGNVERSFFQIEKESIVSILKIDHLPRFDGTLPELREIRNPRNLLDICILQKMQEMF